MTRNKPLACSLLVLITWILLGIAPAPSQGQSPNSIASHAPEPTILGFKDFRAQSVVEHRFLSIPMAQLAGQHLQALTARPHLAGTPEDYATAEYVAAKFRAAGLETEILPYRVWMNQPRTVHVEAYAPDGRLLMQGPQREHVEDDAYQDDPRIVMPFNGSSGSGEVTAEVIYANYGRIEDFDELAARHIDLHGKIVLMRYGANFRGVKVYIAEQRGAAAVLLYSDPQEDGNSKGNVYPMGPWRPDTAVERGSVQYLFRYPGDPQTPGIASTPDLPESARTSAFGNQPQIIAIPLSSHDASPILEALNGPAAPRGWQGGLPFRYHIGPGSVRAHLISDQNYQLRTIWNVVGKIRGRQAPDEWVIAGNHRDAWVYGAADPSSGTAAMLEAVHGIGVLLKHGWRPRRTILFASWDAEEEGLIGSTEWVEQHASDLQKIDAYLNMDIGVSGTLFEASAVPSLRRWLREISMAIPSPFGGTVYSAWTRNQRPTQSRRRKGRFAIPDDHEPPVVELGSGSDYTPFLQHAGVPSTDVGATGAYGVYHSTFDDFAWFVQNVDPHFVFIEQMARVLGLEALRMADADVLPYDYSTYARSIRGYLDTAQNKASDAHLSPLDFSMAQAAVARFILAADQVALLQAHPHGNLTRLNTALRQTESALLSDTGLPRRPWYKHLIYAPGEYTGYAAVTIPGVNEAIDSKDLARAAEQLGELASALSRAAATLEAVTPTH